MAPVDYTQAGVDYEPLDAFKRLCQEAAARTTIALQQHGLAEPPGIRGESAYLIETADEYLAHVEEGLGTKNLIADVMRRLTGECYYHAIGFDTVATIVNDIITCGALPISIAMHAAAGSSEWFADQRRIRQLARGFGEACLRSGAVWGGGETPTLKGIVNPDAVVLAGSAIGRIRPKSRRIRGELSAGDAIIFLASSGVHTNGLTLCRAIADQLPRGYLTPLGDGTAYGHTLLRPSVIYVDFVRAAQQADLDLHYLCHLTGHGWRKLMRADARLVYEIDQPGDVPPLFRFIVDSGPVTLRDAYATFNMGVGFAAYVADRDATRTIELARRAGYLAWRGGTARDAGGRKAVVLTSAGIEFDEASLQVR